MGWFTNTYNWLTDLQQGIGIRADRHTAQDNLFANGISASLCVNPTVNGQNPPFVPTVPTINVDWGGYRIINAGNGINAQDYATVSQLTGSANSPVWAGSFGGTANAVIITLTPPLASYGAGGVYIEGIVTATNTGNVTVNVSGLGIKNVFKNGTQQLEPGDWKIGQVVQIGWDGTQFQNMSPVAGTLTQTGTQTYAVAGGTADVITATFNPVPGLVSYPAGFMGRVKAASRNTSTTPTINFNGIGAVTITKDGGQPLRAGDIVPDQIYTFVYDSVTPSMQLISPISGTINQSGYPIYAVDSGIADAIAIAFVPAITTATLQQGMVFRVKVAATNTGATTVAVGGGSTVPLKKQTNVALAAGDILINSIIEIGYDGTNFQILSPLGNNVTSLATAGLATGGTITSTGTITVTAAIKATQQTGTSNTTVVTPAVQQYHKSANKAWVIFDGTGSAPFTIHDSYNVGSVTGAGGGEYTVNFTVPFSSTNIICKGMSAYNISNQVTQPNIGDPASITTSSFPIEVRLTNGTATSGCTYISLEFSGNQ